MIGVSGLARAGKDTMAQCLKKIVERELKCKVEIVHLADELKSDLDKLISTKLNCLVFTEDNQEKELIRPILVSYGEAMKKKHGKDVWLRKLNNKMQEKSKLEKIFYIVSDVRFDFEADFIKEDLNGCVIHISKINNDIEPNDTEKLNDPLVRKKSDIKHSWPICHPNNMDTCQDHAEVLWQMLSEDSKNLWQKTLS